MDTNKLGYISVCMQNIFAAQSTNDLKSALGDGYFSLGFNNYMYGLYDRSKNEISPKGTLQLTTWSPEFIEEYGRTWSQHDPHLKLAVSSGSATSWTSRKRPTEKNQNEFIDFLVSNESRSGLLLPMIAQGHFLGGSVLSSSTEQQADQDAVNAAMRLSIAACMRLTLLDLGGEVKTNEAALIALAGLTARQHEILKWISEGKSNFEIAMILSMSKGNVDYHVGNILKKLNVATRAQAAAAFTKG